MLHLVGDLERGHDVRLAEGGKHCQCVKFFDVYEAHTIVHLNSLCCNIRCETKLRHDQDQCTYPKHVYTTSYAWLMQLLSINCHFHSANWRRSSNLFYRAVLALLQILNILKGWVNIMTKENTCEDIWNPFSFNGCCKLIKMFSVPFKDVAACRSCSFMVYKRNPYLNFSNTTHTSIL